MYEVNGVENNDDGVYDMTAKVSALKANDLNFCLFLFVFAMYGWPVIGIVHTPSHLVTHKGARKRHRNQQR